MNEQLTIPTNPAWTAPVVQIDGRTWLDTTGSALLHPSAFGQTFRIEAHEYTHESAALRGGLVCVATGSGVPVLMHPTHRVLIEVHP